VFCGQLNALGKQKHALMINFVTYFLVVIPVAWFMAHKYGDHEFYGVIDVDNFKFLPLNLK